MAEFKKKSRLELEKMTEIERKDYYKKYIDSLRLEEKQLKRQLVVKAKQTEIENRKRVNHAMYLVAGELFNSEYAVPFLKSLSSKTRFTSRHTEDLNLLMTSKGLDKIIKFTPCEETKKDKDKSESKDNSASVKQNAEKAPSEPNSEEILSEAKV